MTSHRIPRGLAHALALGAALLLAPGRAAAQPEALAAQPEAPAARSEALAAPPRPQESAWSRGVPEAERAQAEALFREGNALLKESITVSAAAKYREALAHWDHPSIHYNLALALMTLDQPIETSQHLRAAMRYGPAPLQQERFEHARNYLSLLEQQLVSLKVGCQVKGARVELDGQPLFVAPGEHEGLVRAGRHTLVASREGYVTNRLVRTLEGGKPAVVDLELKTLEQLTQVRRRWPQWIPWSLAGAGAAVVLAGGGLQYAGLQQVDKVDRESRLRCPTGCAVEPADLASARRSGRSQQRLAMGAYAVGGAALAAGAVLMVLNRAERVVRSYEAEAPGEPQADPPRQAATFELYPVLDRDAPGLIALVRF